MNSSVYNLYAYICQKVAPYPISQAVVYVYIYYVYYIYWLMPNGAHNVLINNYGRHFIYIRPTLARNRFSFRKVHEKHEKRSRKRDVKMLRTYLCLFFLRCTRREGNWKPISSPLDMQNSNITLAVSGRGRTTDKQIYSYSAIIRNDAAVAAQR